MTTRGSRFSGSTFVLGIEFRSPGSTASAFTYRARMHMVCVCTLCLKLNDGFVMLLHILLILKFHYGVMIFIFAFFHFDMCVVRARVGICMFACVCTHVCAHVMAAVRSALITLLFYYSSRLRCRARSDITRPLASAFRRCCVCLCEAGIVELLGICTPVPSLLTASSVMTEPRLHHPVFVCLFTISE